MSTFPDGLFQYGGQPVGSAWASPWSTVRFVDAATGSDAFDGLKPTQAMATIQAAVTASGRGDVIYVRPQAYVVGTGFSRYTEEVTTVLTQSDLSIIGTVNTKNPEYGVRWKHATNTTGYCLVNIAPALHIENIGFFAESAAGAMSILNNGATNTQRGTDGTTIYNCVIKGKGIKVLSGGDGFTVQNTRFHCGYDGAVADLNYSCSVNPGRRLLVRNCEWQDGNGTTSSGPCITIAPPLSEILIRDCHFGQLPTGGAYISAAGASNYGLISNCYFGVADMVLATGILAGSMVVAGCYDGKVVLID